MEPAAAHPALASLIDLRGRGALVTGAAQGFGFACARRLAEAGAAVYIVDLHEAKAQGAAERLRALGHTAGAGVADVGREDDVQRAFDAAVAELGQLDVLVNNAGAYSNYVVEHMPGDEFRRVIDVNVNGAFYCIQAFARHVLGREGTGTVVNVTSIDAIHPSSKGMSHYTGSKHALWGLTKSLANELGPRGIRVNAVAPGPSLTEGVVEYIEAGAEEGIDIRAHWDEAALRVPLQRWADPDEIARVALFLACDLSAYMTGTQVVVDGGYLLG
jgi:NAD(P)-dependent dehydrogenase (short-subunit alcohol dehydrogenase family)